MVTDLLRHGCIWLQLKVGNCVSMVVNRVRSERENSAQTSPYYRRAHSVAQDQEPQARTLDSLSARSGLAAFARQHFSTAAAPPCQPGRLAQAKAEVLKC
jgi:hypothetical protein